MYVVKTSDKLPFDLKAAEASWYLLRLLSGREPQGLRRQLREPCLQARQDVCFTGVTDNIVRTWSALRTGEMFLKEG